MKLVSWNCGGALRNKLHAIDKLDADILVIQECEDPSRSTKDYEDWAGNYIWIGDSKNKGIGVFARNNCFIESLDWNNNYSIEAFSGNRSAKWSTSQLKYFLPFRVNSDFNVIAVWTKGSDNGYFGYIGQVWKFIQAHKDDLATEPVILIGDFNSNSIWDRDDAWWNHSDVVNELKEIDIHSAYHYKNQEEHGQERQATFYMYRKKERPYHIDYAFIASSLLKKTNIELGERDVWLNYSDHIPLTLEII